MPTPRKILPTTLDELRRNLEQLKLHAMLAGLDESLQQAQTLQQGYSTFLASLLDKEVLARAESASARRIKAAAFPAVKTFDTFNFGFQPGLNVQLAKDLMNLDFVRQGRPVLLLGRPGTGKTHLSLAYGHLAALKGYKWRFFACSRLLEQLYASLADASTDKLSGARRRSTCSSSTTCAPWCRRQSTPASCTKVIDARQAAESTLLSSNLSVDAWGKALGDKTLTASIVDLGHGARLHPQHQTRPILPAPRSRTRRLRASSPTAWTWLPRPRPLWRALPTGQSVRPSCSSELPAAE